MTTTLTHPVPTTGAAAVPTTTAPITESIRVKIVQIRAEMNDLVKERADVIDGLLVAGIAQEHVLIEGPPGTAKSFMLRNWFQRIVDAQPFETALDEQSVADQLFGPPDIKGMVELGKTRRVTTGMLPEATHAFVDEVMNANGTVKHSLLPIMNERVFHNNGMPMATPLRQLVAGTNHNDCDKDPSLVAVWDRFHLRYHVGYIGSRNARFEMVTSAIARMAASGRGTVTNVAPQTTITLGELDQAHAEALALSMDDAVLGLYDDIWEELKAKGIILSDRRYVEAMAAVLANAWLRGHADVQPGDLDVLAAIWWDTHENATEARSVILQATNPGEKVALDLLDELDKFKSQLREADSLDIEKKRRVGLEIIRNATNLINEATEAIKTSKAAGMATTRLDDAVARAEALKVQIAGDVFGAKV